MVKICKNDVFDTYSIRINSFGDTVVMLPDQSLNGARLASNEEIRELSGKIIYWELLDDSAASKYKYGQTTWQSLKTIHFNLHSTAVSVTYRLLILI